MEQTLATLGQPEKSVSHRKILDSLTNLDINGYDPLLIEPTGRLDLPNNSFQANQKALSQRKTSLCYADAVMHVKCTLRMMIEVVDNSPTSPNGITGLTVNADRIVETHPGIDLVFVVLAEMKDFYCIYCASGHRLSNKGRLHCLGRCIGPRPDESACERLIHEGKAANFKKALVDYPIERYLRNISPPSVLFLNSTKVANNWAAYEGKALQLIRNEISIVLSSGKRNKTRLVGVQELLPESVSALS